MKLSDLGELKLLQTFFSLIKKPAAKSIIVNIGDDAAVVKSKSGYLVLTTDTLVENVHFIRSKISPTDLGYKTVAVNVSDIAAMAAQPKYALISLSLPENLDVDFIKRFYEGLNEAAQEYELDLIGGDLSAAKQIVISLTVVGFSQLKQQIKTRSLAQEGDYILVTGSLGAAAAGLWLILNPQAASKVPEALNLIKAHVRPKARVKESLFLAAHGCKALEDISDGLARDIANICLASNVGCLIEEEKLPVADGVAQVADLSGQRVTDLALSGGEDYELVFTVGAKKLKKLLSKASLAKIKITVVGQIKEAEFGYQLLTKKGQLQPLKGGYEHYRG